MTMGRAGGGGRPGGGQPVRAGDGRVRLERQHGAHHEGAGPARLLHVLLHDLQEDHGDQPRQHHRLGARPLPLPGPVLPWLLPKP